MASNQPRRSIPPARDPARAPGTMPESVHRREEQYQLLVTYVRDYAIFSTDAGGLIRSWNEGVRNVLGYEADELVGLPTLVLFTEEDVAAGVPERELADAAASGHANDDRWLRRRNGEHFWASGITTAIRDEQGTLIGFTKVLRDLTERKRSEEALRISEERMQLATSAARLGTWDYDPATRRFALDPRSRELFGFALARTDEEPVEHDRLLDRIQPSHRGLAQAGIERALSPADGPYDVEVPRVGHPVCWIRITGRAYFDGQHAVRFVGTAQDVTPRKQAELARDALFELERAARTEAERANRLKDDFLGTLSHELRTPLNAILGYTRLLQTGRMDAERQHHALQVIERNAQAQTRLVEDILDISRMVRGLLRLDAHPVDLRAVVGDAVDVAVPAIAAKQLHLTWVPPGTPMTVLGDADRLRQVVTNLLANATKFTPADGAIAVTLDRSGHDVVLVVSDSGIGITADFLPNVFERFRQADARPARGHGGLGLGLSIVRHLAELHGGTVQAASAGANTGTTFTLRLPALDGVVPPPLPPQESASRPEPVVGVRFDGLRLLVVDDNPEAVELMRHLLEHRGAQVTVATSAERALQEVTVVKPHVVISDVGMPEVDGLELIKRLRERGFHAPAIAVTAYARREDVARAIDAGYQAHVAKPIDWTVLYERIAALAPIAR